MSRRLATLVPALFFAGLGGLFFWAVFSGEPDRLPSALVGKPVPVFVLPGIEGLETPGLSDADLENGEITLVNVWASWCVPCRQEHPVLEELANRHGIRLVGLNYKDASRAARRFLTELGNPFERIGADKKGRVAIDWGVYGVPETFLVDGRGHVIYRHTGPLSEETVRTQILPLVACITDGQKPCP